MDGFYSNKNSGSFAFYSDEAERWQFSQLRVENKISYDIIGVGIGRGKYAIQSFGDLLIL